jgi:outer membrane biosynthesis protein TonB
MSVAVKASARNLPALAVSLALHGSLALPLAAGLFGRAAPQVRVDPRESIAFVGTSVEVEAPTSEVGASVAGHEIPVEPTEPEPAVASPQEPNPEPAPLPAPEPRPVRPATPAPASPRPRKPAASRPKPSAAAAASAATARPGAESSSTPNAPGSFGAEGLPPGVRRLGYGFSRAIPVATPADAVWKELPTGVVGTIRIEITVGEDNRVDGMQVLPPRRGESPTHPALERMAQRTLMQLKVGQFALSGSNDSGKERLAIEVRLRDSDPDEDAKGLVVQKGFEGAKPGQPGRAYFRYDTGRWFEAKVTIVQGSN